MQIAKELELFPNIWKRNMRSCTDVDRCKCKFSFTGQVSQL